MKILILSDSHNDLVSINKAIQLEDDAQYIFHAGDYAKDIRMINTFGKVVFTVRGNCDGTISTDNYDELFTLEGIRFLLTHGHKYGVKNDLSILTSAAKDQKADVVIFGHTHNPVCINSEGILMINPGSISYYKSNQQTYAVILTDGKGDIIKAEIRNL